MKMRKLYKWILVGIHIIEELIAFAEILGAGLSHVLVGFYVIDNNIYFGEMTFSYESGTEKFTSYDFALEMGSWL